MIGNTAPVRANCGCIRPWLSLILLNVVGIQSFNSHNALDALKLSSILFGDRTLSLNDAQPYLHTATLLFFQSFSVFGQNHRLLRGGILRLRVGVGVGKIFPTPSPTPTQAKTVDSDQLQLRSRLRFRSPSPGDVTTGQSRLQRRWPGATTMKLSMHMGTLAIYQTLDLSPGVEPPGFDF